MEDSDRPSCMFARTCHVSSFRHEKRKRKRVHVPHSKRPKEFVVHRNSKERQRVGEMATAFDALTSVLPSSGDNVKQPTRIDVLRGAIDYIHELESKLIDGDRNENSERCYHTAGIEERLCQDIWIDSHLDAISGSLDSVTSDRQTVHDLMSSANYIGASNTENGSALVEAGTVGYAFPSAAETMCNESMSMLEASPSNVEFPHIPNEQPVYEHEAFRGISQEHYSHEDMMHDSLVNTVYSEIHMNTRIETRQRLVDITNIHYNTRESHSYNTYEILKPLVSDLHNFDPQYPGQRMEMGIHGVPSDPLNTLEENNTGFYSIF